ncbi:hypothetical protein ACOMHN_005791 [Nucella lapillus]
MQHTVSYFWVERQKTGKEVVMKATLVLCVLALAVALVMGSGGGDHGGHGAADHADPHAAAGGHGDAGGHGSESGHAAGDAHGKNAATSLQLCSTLLSFVVLAVANKLR